MCCLTGGLCRRSGPGLSGGGSAEPVWLGKILTGTCGHRIAQRSPASVGACRVRVRAYKGGHRVDSETHTHTVTHTHTQTPPQPPGQAKTRWHVWEAKHANKTCAVPSQPT